VNNNTSISPFDLPLERGCKILDYHPSGIWAIEKTTGVLTHPNPQGKDERTLLRGTYDIKHEKYHWIDAQGNKRDFYLVHRLDSATSGLILAASNIKIAEKLKNAFHNRKVKKTYLAIVDYNGKKIIPTWKDFLQKKMFKGKIRVFAAKSGDLALTSVSIERNTSTQYGDLALLKLNPKTGRTHQLRVQCANRKLPIIGDRTYGNFALNRKISKTTKVQRLCLHSSRIEVCLEYNGKSIKWESESAMPRAFARLLH